MAGRSDPNTDGTVDLLIERLEQSLARSTNLVQLIQKHIISEPEKGQWERVNEILYQVHAAVTGERTRHNP